MNKLTMDAIKQAEREIVSATIHAAEQDGWSLYFVDNGDEQVMVHTAMDALEHIFSVDESRVTFQDAKGHKQTWLNVVLGNDGWNPISDYGVSLEAAIRSTDALCDKWEDLLCNA